MSKRRRAPDLNKRLLNSYLPPEGVPLKFEVASLGARFAAQLADLLITTVAIICMIILFSFAGLNNGSFLFAFAALMFFAVRVPYYVLTELLWNGQTLGKRMMGLRVISADGRQVTPYAVTVRNFMKEAEVFAPGTAIIAIETVPGWAKLLTLLYVFIVLAVPLLNKRRQRLGDIIAGTYVVDAPRAILLPELANSPSDAHFVFTPDHLNEYGRYELQTLEKLLQAQPTSSAGDVTERRKKALKKVCNTICGRIGYEDPIADTDTEAFLTAFYKAQRAFLENRQIFGDKREDKFHRPKQSTTKQDGQTRGS